VAADRLEAGGDAGGGRQRDAGAVPVAAPEGVLQPQFERVDVQPFRDQIHHPLEGEADLDHAESPHGPGDRRIRVDAPPLDQRVRDAVRAAGVLHAQGHHLPAQVGVGPRVVVEAAVQGVQGAVVLRAQPVDHPDRVALVSGQHVFPAVPPHLDRPSARPLGGKGKKTLHGGAVLPAERPAQVRPNDAHPVHGNAQGGADLPAVPKGRLRGDGEDDPAIGLLPGDAVFGLQEPVGYDGHLEGFLDDDVGIGQALRRRPLADGGLQKDVAGVVFVDEGRARRQGFVDAEDAGKRFDVQADQGEGPLERVRVFGDRERHGIAAVPDLVAAQDGLVLVDDALPVRPGHVRGRQDIDDAGKRPRRAGLHAADTAVGNIRPLDAGPKKMISVIVGGVTFAARCLGRRVRPGDGSTDFRDVALHVAVQSSNGCFSAFPVL